MKKHLLPLFAFLFIIACKKSGGNTEPVEEETDEWNAQTGGKSLTADLTGKAEVPGPGDNNGKGTLELSLNIGKRAIAYRLTVSEIATATAAQLHEGAAGEAGPVRISLKAPANGTIKDTITELDRTLLQRLAKDPKNFYVKVVNAPYPQGAIRGQLSK